MSASLEPEEKLNYAELLRQLETDASRIRALVEGVSSEQAHWKPTPETWSIVEVISHLHDEERFDFRIRLDYILHRPGEPWPPIDPQGWVTGRKYNDHNLPEVLGNFLGERQASLDWLRSLAGPDWTTTATTPWGTMTAGDMFVSWVTHDSLHMRQLVELIHAWIARESGTYQADYAGEW
jgi:hypothetical protein